MKQLLVSVHLCNFTPYTMLLWKTLHFSFSKMLYKHVLYKPSIIASVNNNWFNALKCVLQFIRCSHLINDSLIVAQVNCDEWEAV